MSTPAKTKADARPKRPLSGYNLFYRYKRNKVLEATANGGDSKAVIHAVLTAVAGLEGIPPHSPIFGAPLAHINAYRAASIRAAMEGKLFPNENTRNRLHRKVHGMGFVEMGKMMRQTWGRADMFTKDLFCQLADVGRVRYRMLAAEYKRKQDASKDATSEVGLETIASQSSSGAASIGGGIAALKAAAAAEAAKPPFVPDQASSSDPAIAASAEPKPEPKSYGRRVSATDLDFQAPVSDGGISGRFGHPSFDATTKLATANDVADPEKAPRPTYQRRVSERSIGPSYQRKASAELDRCGDSLQPLPVETTNGASAVPKTSNAPIQGRRVSTDVFPAVNSGVRPSYQRRVSAELDPVGVGASFPAANGGVGNAPAAFAMGDRNVGPDDLERLKMKLARQQLMIKNRIKEIRGSIVQNNALLPPEMRVVLDNDVMGKGGCAQSTSALSNASNGGGGGNVSGKKAYLDIMASSRPSLPDSSVVGGDDPGVGEEPERGAVSAQDFMEFIDELDDAIDIDDAAAGTTEEKKDRAGAPDTVPIPAGCKKLNAKGARTA